MNIPPSKAVNAIIKTGKIKDHQIKYIKKLARIEDVIITAPGAEKPLGSASAVSKDFEIFIPLEGLIDLDVERKRLQKEIERIENSLTGIIKKLSNEKFVNNAAPDIVEKERIKKKDWEENLAKLKDNLNNLG
jgi:valyl-tRNA synthetase